MGMLVAYATSITLLPALLTVLNPKGEPEPLGFAFLAPVDRFMEDHRIAIIVGVAIVSLGGLPLLYYLQFDFNPINLRNPRVESIATFLDLRRDPITGANAISVLAPNVAATRPIEERLSKLPEVSQVRTLDYFVPPDQDKKLAAIKIARDKIMPSFAPEAAQTPPTDAEDVEALNDVVTALNESATKHPGGPGAAAAQRLAALLEKLAKSTPEMRQKVAGAFLRPLKTALADRRISCRRIRWRLPTCRTTSPSCGRRRMGARASRCCRKAIRTTTRPCASSRARCWRFSRTRPAARSRFWNPATRS
jgi:hypothetical protein